VSCAVDVRHLALLDHIAISGPTEDRVVEWSIACTITSCIPPS
jgi:hypothetical protein